MNICEENQIFMFDLEILVKYIYGTNILKTTFVSLLYYLQQCEQLETPLDPVYLVNGVNTALLNSISRRCIGSKWPTTQMAGRHLGPDLKG